MLVAIYVLALVVTKTSEIMFYDTNPYFHLGFGVLVFAVNFAAIFKFETRYREFAFKFLKKIKLA